MYGTSPDKERKTGAGVKTQQQLEAKTKSTLSTAEIRLRVFKTKMSEGKREREGTPSALDPAPGWWSRGTVLSNPVCTSQQILRGKHWCLQSWGHLEFGGNWPYGH